jgi:hypothetical protein
MSAIKNNKVYGNTGTIAVRKLDHSSWGTRLVNNNLSCYLAHGYRSATVLSA